MSSQNGTVFTPPTLSSVITSPGQPATSSPAVIVDTTPNPVTSFTSQPPTIATTIPPTSAATVSTQANIQTTEPPQSTRIETSVLTAPPTTNSNGVATTNPPATVVVTSTQSTSTSPITSRIETTTSLPAASKSSDAAALATSTSNSSSGGGLSPGGKIAIAVVVPVAAVAFVVLVALFFWRRHRSKKDAEELRRKEVEEYGFNPNNDPTLPAVGGASSSGDEPSEMRETDGSGYRGWGATSTNRKPSTTLSSGNGPIGMARSTSNSDNGRYTNNSPTAGTNKSSDVQSGDPLVGSPSNGRPLTADSETIGALGAVPTNGNNRQDIHRGPSNASSAYSGAHVSDTSGDGAIPGGAPGQQFYNDGLFYDEGMPQHGPYGDGSYGGGQPVIRDVQARRNTRIENPSIIPQQGNAGIAQNF